MAVGDSPMVDPTAPPAPLPRQQWSVHHESIVAACRDQFDPDITRKPPTSGPVDRGITTATVPPRPAGGAIVSGTGSMTTLLTKSELHARRRDTTAAKQSVSYANTNPLWIVRGSGQYLYDEQNLRYLDTRNNVAHVGHCHPTVVEAITAQAGLLNTNTRYLHENLVTFATELLETFGPQNTHEMRKVFVVNSGSEANDLALRLIEAYHQKHSRRRRDDTVVVDHGYHGHTKSVVDISPYKWVEQKSHIHVIPAPKGEEGSKQSLAVLENILERDVADAAAASLLASPGDEEDGKNAGAATSRKVGAMFIESGMSVAGVLIPHADYLNRAASLIRNHGGLFVADEVQTGLGRFGDRWWGFQMANGLVPDIVTAGKPLGNGMPLAVVITTEKIANCLEKEYFNTFGGNPVSCAAGLAVLKVLNEEWLLRRARDVGEYFKRELQTNVQNVVAPPHEGSFPPWAPKLTEVRGKGLFLGLEWSKNCSEGEGEERGGGPATAETSILCTRLLTQHRILTSIDGPDDNVIVIKPPMCFNESNVDEFVSALKRILETFEKLEAGVGHTPT